MAASLRSILLPEARWFSWPVAGALVVLLFVGGPGYHYPRSITSLWDLGHVAAFSLWSYLLLRWKPVEKSSPSRQWRYVLAFCLLFGGATEGIQSITGRDASFGDLLLDLLGGMITLSWIHPVSNDIPRGIRHAMKGISASLLLVACIPLMVSICDEWLARARFPVLSDFETPFEKDRWEGGARFLVDRSVARHGNASLRVMMDTSQYSGIALVYFPGDWRGYRFLRLELLNPSTGNIDVTCRIHDGIHETMERSYDDRYNKNFHLLPGWNSLRIDLEEVLRAPVGRRMELGEIKDLGIFSSRLPAPRTIYIDHVRLE